MKFETVEIAHFDVPHGVDSIKQLKESWTNFLFLKLSLLDNDKSYQIDTLFLPVNHINVGDGFVFFDSGHSQNLSGTSLNINVRIRDYNSVSVYYGGYGTDINDTFLIEGICRKI